MVEAGGVVHSTFTQKKVAFFLCYASSSEELVRFVRSCVHCMAVGMFLFAMCLFAVLRVF